MKVQIQIKQTVEYMAEVEMTRAEYEAWEEKLKAVGYRNENDIAEDILNKYGREYGCRLGEPNDWGELSVDTFNPLVRRKAASR